ncbi:MAG: copper amine oxidase N-terminal domain-containing protein [Defluviitaleaceae bacterium]|nr:copper amine oxidase N-terminal domain-containing protein [Defluviitaleaceae bacterium]MCL2263484.1 copper amine oxidase N-terminal domain-containing protein [Defluviitaleaceae bacterium]
MRIIKAICLATIMLLFAAPLSVSVLAPPHYPAPRFNCKKELVEWTKTADAYHFHEGNFKSVLPQVREHGAILLPVITDYRITFQSVEVLRFARRGATLFFRYMTPEGQLVIRIEEIDPWFAFEYRNGGIAAYFAAVDTHRYELALNEYLQWDGIPMPSSGGYLQRPMRNDNYQVRQRRINLRDVATREHTAHEISYIHVDNPRTGHFNFANFIINGFSVRVQYVQHQPKIGAFLDGLDWEIPPIIAKISYAEGTRRDITRYVDISPDWRGRRLENYQATIYHNRSNEWGETVARIIAADYSRDGYFAISLSGWNGCTACRTEVASIHDTGNEISIGLQTSSEGVGGQAMTPWSWFLEIPVAFSDREISIMGSERIPPSYCDGTRGPRADTDSDTTVYLNGERLEFDVPPQIIDGRAMVPMRAIFETLGLNVQWLPDIQFIVAYEELTVIGAVRINMRVGTSGMRVETLRAFTGGGDGEDTTQAYEFDERDIEFDVPPQIVDGRTLVPLRAISEALGADVEWNSRTRTINIRT